MAATYWVTYTKDEIKLIRRCRMRDEVCEEIHKRVDERLNQNEKRLDGHSKRIDILEQRGASVDTEMKNLCAQIGSLVATIKWAGILMITTFLGFFIWYVQSLGN